MLKPVKASLKKIAIIGGGPAALYLFKEFTGKSQKGYTIDIFEAGQHLGSGMPYSETGANAEHITNVSANEIPELVTPFIKWIDELPSSSLRKYGINKNHFHEYKVLPRLLFGEFLNDQFNELLDIASKEGLDSCVHLSTRVKDIIDDPVTNKVMIETDNDNYEFDTVIICTGHTWPRKDEGKVKNYFDSPFPPWKIKNQYNHPVAIRGSSLTAIDAMVTLACINGQFIQESTHKLSWIPNADTPDFKMVMHSIQGLLPAIRFHLDDPQLKNDIMLSKKDIFRHIVDNDGFLSLDWLFEKNFKEPMRTKDPAFYKQIRNMTIEEFAKFMMRIRIEADAFQLFKAEYREAASSIRREKPVYWKELLSAFNFLINYPAKHLSAEDMLRFQKALMPLIGIIIAFVPQESCEQMIALQEAGRLDIVSVDEESKVETCKEGGIIYHYKDDAGKEHHTRYLTYIDCTGQPQLSMNDLPFKGLVKDGGLSAARIKFRSPEEGKKEKEKGTKEVEQEGDSWYLNVPGIAITDSFSPIDKEGNINPRIYMLASPFISGYNPDFSGLDFCATAAGIVTEDIFS